MRSLALALTAVATAALADPEPPVAPPAGVTTALTWKRMPQQAWLCSRHGPDWDVGTGPDSIGGRVWAGTFTLTLAPGQKVKFRAEARAADKSSITYATTGWPAGAAIDATRGTFEWVAAGDPEQRFSVVVTARTASGAEISTPIDVVIASEAVQAAWKAGLGGKAWPDCTARPPEVTYTPLDLDGADPPDLLVSASWYDRTDPHQHRFSRHALLIRGPRGARSVPWLDDEGGVMASVQVAKAVGGRALLVVTRHACAGGEPVELFTLKGGEVVSVGAFDPPESLEAAFDVKLLPGADGGIEAVEVRTEAKVEKFTWKDGQFQP